MTDFITVADVDQRLGQGWAGSGDAVLAVAMANAWLTAKIKRAVPKVVPDAIITAGVQVAKLAADGKLDEGQTWVQASITGSQFQGRYEREGERIRPFITGRAYMTADSTLLIDEQDPFAWGI